MAKNFENDINALIEEKKYKVIKDIVLKFCVCLHSIFLTDELCKGIEMERDGA